MSIVQIQDKVKQVLEKFSCKNFIYDLLVAYNTPKATIARLQRGTSNLAKGKGEVLLKSKLYFKEVLKEDLHASIDKIMHDPSILRFYPRFIVVTDYNTLLSVDTKIKDTLDIPFKELVKNFDFFLPWAGMEKSRESSENPVDIKAAYKMAKLYDLIRKDNPGLQKDRLHELNVFLSRLLFCFFAEDTEIFDSKLFSNSIASHTQEDGSDLSKYLHTLFEVLNSKDSSKYPLFLQKFPYVNGGLFGQEIKVPKFSKESRKMIIECGSDLNWAEINPDIFGSMMQAVVHPDQRHGMGMHYTSVVNIMKVIEPLFLNELKDEFENSYDDKGKLRNLLKRLSNLKFFDPACGSGNFLIITFKEIRKLEMEIIYRLQEISGQGELPFSNIRLSQFSGIEIDDFAHEIAKLSLWLAEHQMNLAFKKEFGQTLPTLPLKEAGNILCDNATRLDWGKICRKDEKNEIFILGNPPYLGFLQQKSSQKEDMDFVFNDVKNIKKLDYISCWFYKGSQFIEKYGASLAFVSTNSICQGEQVSLFWPHILEKMHIEIAFSYQSFKWTNNAKSNAGVTCVIVGLRLKSKNTKYIYIGPRKIEVFNINAYLAEGNNVYVEKMLHPISQLPKISLGSSAYDGGHLMLTKEERNKIVQQYPEANEFIRRFVGSEEFIQGIERYCLWIEDRQLKKAKSIPVIMDRLSKVTAFRKKSDRKLTYETSKTPHVFAENRHQDKPSIIIPIVSSERRKYYTCGFLTGSEIIPNSARAIYDAKPYIFGILSSLMHMVWVRAVSGQLETRLRYSAGVCYNAFPIPNLTEKAKDTITSHVFSIIGERERYPEKTIADLYDPERMPESLRKAHNGLDEVIERCYQSKPFESDEDRLKYLFKLYEEMKKKDKNA